MPLSINVGLSRKASRNYQSTGVSINVTAELDPALLAKPDELQRQIHDLYSQAEQAMNRQAGQLSGADGHERANGHDRGDGDSNGNGRPAVPRDVPEQRPLDDA